MHSAPESSTLQVDRWQLSPRSLRIFLEISIEPLRSSSLRLLCPDFPTITRIVEREGRKKETKEKRNNVTSVWKSCDSIDFGIKIAGESFRRRFEGRSTNLRPAVNLLDGVAVLSISTVLADHVINRFGKLIRSTAKAIVNVRIKCTVTGGEDC